MRVCAEGSFAGEPFDTVGGVGGGGAAADAVDAAGAAEVDTVVVADAAEPHSIDSSVLQPERCSTV